MVEITQKAPLSQADISTRVLLKENSVIASGVCVGSASALHAPLVASDADRASDHPSLTSNNSIKSVNKGIPDGSIEEKNKNWKKWKDEIEPKLSGYQWKCSHRMQEIIRLVAEYHGQDSIGVMDLTFGGEDAPSYEYANGCLNSFMTNVFRPRYGKNYMVVCERGGKFGRFHFHILFSKKGADFRTGSRKQVTKRGKVNFFPNATCRKEFDYLRPILKGYGFGDRVRIQPLWDIGKGAKYFSKYIGKGAYSRSEEMKGRQLVRYGAGFSKYCSMRFSKVHGVSVERRSILAMLGGRYGCVNTDELKETLGTRWQYYAGDQMRYLGDVTRGRGYPKQMEWLDLYMWNRYKMKLICRDRGDGDLVIIGAYNYQIKHSKAFQHVGSSQFAPDDDWEPTGILDKENLIAHAWRELILKIEMDYGERVALDPPPLPNIIKNKNGYSNNKRLGTDSEENGRTHEATQLGLVGLAG